MKRIAIALVMTGCVAVDAGGQSECEPPAPACEYVPRYTYGYDHPLHCDDTSERRFEAEAALGAASARLGCCIVGCCDEPGCHAGADRYAVATDCAGLEALMWGAR